MADDKKKNTIPTAAPPEGWAKINTEFLPSFKPELFAQRIEGTKDEKYVGGPIQGYVLGMEKRDVADDVGEITTRTMLVVQLTKDTDFKNGKVPIVKGAEDEPYDAKAGEQITVWGTAKILQAIPEKAANHSTHMIEVWIMPTMRKPFTPKSGGEERKLWDFDVRVNPKVHKRTGDTVGAAGVLAELMDQNRPQLQG